jgi:hypothetical protein
LTILYFLCSCAPSSVRLYTPRCALTSSRAQPLTPASSIHVARPASRSCPPLCVYHVACAAAAALDAPPTARAKLLCACGIMHYCCVRHSPRRSHPPPLCRMLLLCTLLTSPHASGSRQPPLCVAAMCIAHLVAHPSAHASVLCARFCAHRSPRCTYPLLFVCRVVRLATLTCLLYCTLCRSTRCTLSRSRPSPLCVPHHNLPRA